MYAITILFEGFDVYRIVGGEEHELYGDRSYYDSIVYRLDALE